LFENEASIFSFRDRLVGSKSRDQFDSMLSSVLSGLWSVNTLDRMSEGYYVTWGARQEVIGKFVFFVK